MASTEAEKEAFIEEMQKAKPREIWLELWEARRKLATIEPVSNEITDAYQIDQRYMKGEVIRVIETGVKHPNGYIHWIEDDRYAQKDEQDRYLRQWNTELMRLNIEVESVGRPVFVTRVKQYSFSENTILA